ncbi:MAG: hypothetical protein RLZZ416_142 [Candidatus Parcubacteria bacterium]|jgi:RNA polymerase sigma-70 factor (ECF subfamily)
MRGDDDETRFTQELEGAFLASYEECADAVFRHCLARVRDREIAKDITQETFSRAWLYLSEGKTIEYMRAFLYRVANNLIVDHARRKKASSLDSMMEEDGFEVEDETTPDPTNRQAAREAMRLLDSLDEIYQTAISMRFLEDMSPREIAAALGVSENVVSVRIHRGIERLRKLADEKRTGFA